MLLKIELIFMQCF